MTEVKSIRSEYDIFLYRPFQTAVLGTVETVYKTLARVEQNDWEFLIPGDTYTYIDLDIKLYGSDKMVSSSGNDVDLTDTTAVANNLLHSLFSQCTVMLNVVPVSQSHEHYNYRAYLEYLLKYGTDAASSRLSYSYWYLDSGDIVLQSHCRNALLRHKRRINSPLLHAEWQQGCPTIRASTS